MVKHAPSCQIYPPIYRLIVHIHLLKCLMSTKLQEFARTKERFLGRRVGLKSL